MIKTKKVRDAQDRVIAEIFPVGVIGYDEEIWAYRFIKEGETFGVVVNTELRSREWCIQVVRNIAALSRLAER